MNFTRLLVLLLLLFSTGLTSAQDTDATSDATADAGEPYRIGAFVSLSGPLESLGQPQANTLEMIARQVNALGGIVGPDGARHPLELVIYDDESNQDVALAQVTRLIEQDDVTLLIGGPSSASSLAVADVVTAAEIPFIAMAGSSEIALESPEQPRRWVFKTTQQSARTFEVLASTLQARGITQVASLAIDDPYGIDSLHGMQAAFVAVGIDIIYDEVFPTGADDFTVYLDAVAEADAEALIVHATTVPSAALTVQFAERGLDALLIQTPGVGNQTYLDLAGEAADGVLAPIGKLLVAGQLPQGDPQRDALLAYIDQYTTAYNEPASTFGGHAWDALYLAMFAMQAAGPDPAGIRDWLENDVNEWVGITGIYTITPDDHVGLDARGVVVAQVVDGAWTYVPMADAS